ncbi:cation diffusion facilitator family transporter [Carboxydothermus ferrireducens]|uniref:Cation diffusion facilitator family transporter n=1 Tax=Carboxydothermus ferrireducens DSM 11255 TaxID=1119529 RepID=A0ABX2R939_9THEO|nr:cation diffusion facilitator family transporter [Carboxydothermus ferrireducens]NYE56380.1 cation diffusion facilitator family transporter [Carboxydothermus ferrireducens DSM 11255]
MNDKKVSWARLSIISNTLLVLFKIVVGFFTGSVSIIAEGLHSGVDLLASIITFFSVKVASRPADVRHPYGHGKVENIAGTIEGLLIFLGAVLIIKEALPKFWHPEMPESLGWGMGVMAVSSLVNFFISQTLLKIAKETDSPALEADGWHLRTDVYTSAGVLLGLLLIKLTGITYFDPILALIVAGMILKAAYEITFEGFANMVDTALPEKEIALIKDSIANYGEKFLEFHKLRARKSGSERFIDLHLVVPEKLSVKEVHDLCNKIERDIEEKLPNSHVLIHAEPCQKEQRQCEDCPYCSEKKS